MEFAIQQEGFSGPLGVLLELLEKKELEITEVALAQIADEYVRRLEQVNVPPEEMADFLMIAARLIYIKSRELMPFLIVEEEEEGVERLEEQLRLYRLFAEAAEGIERRYTGNKHGFTRPFRRVSREIEPVFAPAENVHPTTLHTSFQTLLKRLEPFFSLQQVSIERVKSVEERIDELTGALQSRASMSFKDVISGAKRKMDVVVSFLALLELARRRHVSVSQEGGDVMIKRTQSQQDYE